VRESESETKVGRERGGGGVGWAQRGKSESGGRDEWEGAQCLLWIDKARAKYKTYIRVSVWWQWGWQKELVAKGLK
jgi:hypothetical protein